MLTAEDSLRGLAPIMVGDVLTDAAYFERDPVTGKNTGRLQRFQVSEKLPGGGHRLEPIFD